MDWIIAGITGLFIGGFFGVFGMALLSGRAYEKGKADARFSAIKAYSNGYDHGYDDGEKDGYRQAYLDQSTANEVVFTSKTENEGD